mgnify:CR=1 FL=1
MSKKYTLLKSKTTGERRVRINETGEYVSELTDPAEYNKLRKKALRSQNSTKSLYESLGLTRVVGSVSGKVYYE